MDQKLPAKPDSDLSTQAVDEMAKYGIILGYVVNSGHVRRVEDAQSR